MKYKTPYAVINIPIDREKILAFCKKTGLTRRNKNQSFEEFADMLIEFREEEYKDHGFGIEVLSETMEFDRNDYFTENYSCQIIPYSKFMGISDIYVKRSRFISL